MNLELPVWVTLSVDPNFMLIHTNSVSQSSVLIMSDSSKERCRDSLCTALSEGADSESEDKKCA